MPRVATLVLLAAITVYVTSDQIVVKSFQQIFPSAGANQVKTLTNNVNKQTTAGKAKEVIKKWVPKNAAQVSFMMITDPANDPKLIAQKKALTFIDYRYSLKKYINYLYNQAVSSKYLTLAEADSMRTMFWAADKKAANNYTVSSVAFMSEASSKVCSL
uniref:RxLR effector protein n=1 Tax=Caenorhabditis tropicalis TaxID=1561998 RepID=A0A1I7UZP4_9PELO